MLKAKLMLDAEKLACLIVEKVENNIEDSEALESLSKGQLKDLTGILYMSINSACEDFSEFDMVAR